MSFAVSCTNLSFETIAVDLFNIIINNQKVWLIKIAQIVLLGYSFFLFGEQGSCALCAVHLLVQLDLPQPKATPF